MPFTIRPSRRFPIYYPVTYQTGRFEGHGTVWNLSPPVVVPWAQDLSLGAAESLCFYERQ